MKKLLLIATLCLLSTTAFSKTYGPAGCGLGNVIFGDSKGLSMNSTAATTNGTSGNQTFGMTSGTSNCEVNSDTRVASTVFIDANKVALSNDIAKGQGETLVNLSRIYGCKNDQKIGKVLKSNYSEIFTNDANAEIIGARIEGYIQNNQACI